MAKRLLITDDAAIIRELVKDAVKGSDWEVVGEGKNGQEGADLYKATRPDVMTLDLVMPQFDGLHALRLIHEFDPHARVIVVSAINQTNVLKEAFKLGACDFLIKPFQPAQLLGTLNKAYEAGQLAHSR